MRNPERSINWQAGPYLTAMADDDESTAKLRLLLVKAQRTFLETFPPDGRAAAALSLTPTESAVPGEITPLRLDGTGARQASPTTRLIDRVIERLLR